MKLKATGLLTRDEVRAAIHFRQPPRPPRCECHFYTNELLKKYAEEIPVLERDFPDDFGFSAMMIPKWEAPADDPSYCWAFGGRGSTAGASMDEDIIIRDWSDLGRFLAEFPGALHPSAVNGIRATRAERPDGYVLACWHLYFNGRLMDLRGMQNMCMDFLLCPDNLRVVMDRLLEMFRVWAPRAAEAGCDGVWGGEDVAGQEGLIMSPKVFREVLIPYYKELGDILHDSGLDYWWHSDGNITDILEDLVECGVDVVHPMQADCTDDAEVMSQYGGRLAFWVGMDVQHVLPFATPEEVREHIRKRIRAFSCPDGGLIVGPGSTLGPEIPLANLRAYLETLHE